MVLEELRVLIVEVDLSVAESLADTVRAMGLSTVGMVRSGEEAVELTISTKPHLILMDIQLAGDMDGIDTAREIQFRHACAIVFLSEVKHEPTLRRLNSIKYKFYLPKPVTPFQLRQVIPQVVSLLGQPILDIHAVGTNGPLSDSIFISHKSQQERIRLDEIKMESLKGPLVPTA
ncbi:MAG: response regulator, partial [Bacteroidota bacterium]